MAKERVPIEVLETTDQFKALTPKQQLFIQTYIASDYDRIVATRTAFGCKTTNSARCYSYAVLKNPRIIAVLSIHFARDPRADWLKMLEEAARNKTITLAQLLAIKALGEAQGFTQAIPVTQNRDGEAEFDHSRVRRIETQDKTPKPTRGRPRKNPKKPIEPPKADPYSNW